MLKKSFAALILMSFLFIPLFAWAAPPIPARIGGTVTVNGTQLTQATDTGYTITVTKADGTAYVPAAGDLDGLSGTDWYIIDIPIYNLADQPGGAVSGDTAIIKVFKDGSDTGITVTSPVNGEITVGNSGTTTQIDLTVIINLPPTANAGLDQVVDEGVIVTLDGSGSSDPENAALTYAWVQTDGPVLALSDATAVQPTFTTPDVGFGGVVLIFSLTVTDVNNEQDIDTVTVTVGFVNKGPNADAGPNQTVSETVALVTLNGSNSSDPDTGDSIVSYKWTQTVGTAVVLSNDAVAQPTFTPPDLGVGGGVALTFNLTVEDTLGLQDNDDVIVNITFTDTPPSADAGSPQTVNEGETVTLDATASSDSDLGDSIESYLWTQTAGTTVTLSDPTSSQPTFTAPDVGVDGESLTFQVTVTDTAAAGGLKDTATVIITVGFVNQPPVADAGADYSMTEGTTGSLDASASAEPDTGDSIVSYLWTQTAGTATTLSDATAINPNFVAPAVAVAGADITFQVTVTDEGGLQAVSTVTITVIDNGIVGFPVGVQTIKTATLENLGVQAGVGADFTKLEVLDPATLVGDVNRPANLIYGLIDLELKVATPGDTVEITIFFDVPAPDGYTWFKLTSVDGWVDFSDNAVFNADRTQVTLTLTDGGVGDDDGVANGVIVDPSGLGEIAVGPATGGGGCFISTLTDKY